MKPWAVGLVVMLVFTAAILLWSVAVFPALIMAYGILGIVILAVILEYWG